MKAERARELRAEGYTFKQIAAILGSSHTTVQRWIKPEMAERERAASRRWKDANRPQNRERDREFIHRPENRGICASPICANLRGAGTLTKPERRASRGYCADCVSAIADVRRTLAEGMWAAGWSTGAMCEAFGVSRAYFSAARANGWDLPHRRTPEQVERIREGTRRGMGLAA